MSNAAFGAAVALLVGASALGAQVPELPTLGDDWSEVSYPKLFYSGRDGLTIGLYYGQTRPMGYDDYNEPEKYHAQVSVDGQLSGSGRKDLHLSARFPRTIRNWRFAVDFNAYRHPRDYYFGVGNATTYSGDSVRTGQEHFYDVDRRLTRLRGELQREVVRGVRLLAGIQWEQRRLAAPEGPSVLALDAAAGLAPTASERDVAFRFGLIVDTRDDEALSRRGMHVELIHGIADSSLLGDLSYTRTTASAAGYLPLGIKTVIAARAVAQHMGGSPTVGAYYLIEASDDPYEGLGGPESHRALAPARFLGRDKLLASFDVRYDLLRVETLFEATLVGFVDAGRVFETSNVKLTTSGLHTGGGAGLFLRWGRTGVLGTTLGVGPDGAVWQITTRWAY